MRHRSRWLLGGTLALLAIALAASVLFLSPSSMYQLTGSQWQFNRAVSRAVPKGATLAQLEAEVGPGRPVPIPAWLRQTMLRDPSRYPDGLNEEDTCVSYAFPDKSTWYFQVRNGRLVNYDPSVLAGQPQDHIAARF